MLAEFDHDLLHEIDEVIVTLLDLVSVRQVKDYGCGKAEKVG